jgi:hypothetical protein
VRVEPATFDVAAVATSHVNARGRARPRLVVEGGPEDGRDLLVAVAGHETSLDVPFGKPPRAVHLDADATAVVRWRGSFFPVGPVVEGVRRAVVRPPTPHRLRLAEPAPLGWAWIRSVGEPAVEFETPLVADGVVETYVGGPARVELDVGGGRLSFDVDLPTDRAVERTLDPKDALPPPSGFDAVIDLRLPSTSSWSDVWMLPGHVGGWRQDEPQDVRGDSVVVRGPGRFLVQGKGLAGRVVVVDHPRRYAVGWGSCVLSVHAMDADRVPADAMVEVDGFLYPAIGGELVLAGLDAGAHRVIVSPVTWKRRAVELRVVLKEGETRAKTVVLPEQEPTPR